MSRHHAVDFFEIPVLDMAGSKAFYAAAFGWAYKDYGDTYADIQGAGLPGGLRLVKAPPTSGGPLVIIYSDDLEASERAVRAVERAAIAKALQSERNPASAAKKLGISRASIYTKMKAFGLGPDGNASE